MVYGAIATIGHSAAKYGTSAIIGSIAGYEIRHHSGKGGNNEESIRNSIVDSIDNHNYESWFNVTFENGATGIILIVGVILILLSVVLGFFVYCSGCCQCIRRRRNDNLNENVTQLINMIKQNEGTAQNYYLWGRHRGKILFVNKTVFGLQPYNGWNWKGAEHWLFKVIFQRWEKI